MISRVLRRNMKAKYCKSLPDWIINFKVGDEYIACDGEVHKAVEVKNTVFYLVPDWLKNLVYYSPKWLEELEGKLDDKFHDDENLSKLESYLMKGLNKVFDIQIWLHGKLERVFDENGIWPNPVVVDRIATAEDGSCCGLYNCGEEATPENIEANKKHLEWWETEGKKQWEDARYAETT
jgi:hypothetical protein